jgi:RimJ/RimL family protein N-acetyltransferase
MFELESDAQVHKYVGKKPVKTLQQSCEMIDFIRKQYADNGIGRWAIIEKQSDEFIGWTGFKLMREKINGFENFYDFGYRLKQKFWGQGYATESGRAALEFGIPYLQLKFLYAMTDVNNLASQNVLNKLGFVYKGHFEYDAEPHWREKGELTNWHEFIIK